MQARQGKRSRLWTLVLGTGLAAAVAVALIVLGPASGSSAANTAKPAPSVLTGITQKGLTLGDPGAPVELIEFGDLTCPICKQAEEKVLPKVIRTQVATGKAKLTFRNFRVIGPEAVTAGAAAIAAGEQGHGWNFIELFLADQQKPNSGYVDANFLRSVAIASGVEDLARWNTSRKSSKTTAEVEATTKEAFELNLMGTPTFAIRGPQTDGLKILGNPQSAATIVSAIVAAG